MSPVISGGGSSATAALAAGRVKLTTGDLSDSSGSFVNATGVTVTITTNGNPVLVGFSGTLSSTSGDGMGIDLAIDTVRQGGTNGLINIGAPQTGLRANAGFTFLATGLSAASHTFQIMYSSFGASTTLNASTSSPAILWAKEIY